MLKPKNDIHRDVESLLPWLVNSSLSGREHDWVLEHLLTCESCRKTRDELQSLMAVVSEDDATNEDYLPGFRALERRIDAAEREKQVLADFKLQEGDWFSQLNQTMSWLFTRMRYVTATVVVLVVGVVLLSPELMTVVNGNPEASLEADSPYKTLTSPSPQVQGSHHRALITFASSVESEQIREILIETNAKIVRNSDQENTFVIDLEFPPGVSEAEFFAQIRKMESVVSIVAATRI
jgi:hypothetical protein